MTAWRDAYALARNWGWLSVNDVLRLENRDPIGPQGDEYLRPLNTVPLGQEFVRDAAARDPRHLPLSAKKSNGAHGHA